MIDGLGRYRQTRSSGEAWLGDIPEHWKLSRTKSVLNERVEKGHPHEPLLAATQSKGVVRKEEFKSRTVLALKDLHLLKLVRRGDFVISLRSFQGGIEYAREQGIISPAYTVLYPKDSRSHGYLAWLFKSKPYIENLSLFVTGIRQGQNIDYEKLSRSVIPMPPPDEQAAIVRFLDHADRRIRRYIRAKQKLIKLLEEQKQGIIHQSVTRGLEPDVRLKPSGVEWLGDVPEHWAVAALRHRYSQSLGKMLDSKRVAGTDLIPYLRNTDVQWDSINIRDLPSIDVPAAEYERYTVAIGDLLVCEGGDVGRCAIWNGEIEVCGYQKALHRLRPLLPGRDTPRYMYYCLRTASAGRAFNDGHVSTIPHLTGDKLRAHRFPFPPRDEQEEIVAFLDAEASNRDRIKSRLYRSIEAARELQNILVADIVTGKLDVREAAARLPEEVDSPVPIDEEGDVDAEAEGAEELVQVEE